MKQCKIANNDTSRLISKLRDLEVMLHPLQLDPQLSDPETAISEDSCVAKFQTNAIYRFADYTTGVGQISNNNESKYRRQIEGLVMWCNENVRNAGKTKELITDFRKKGGEHAPIYINRTRWRVKSIKFLGLRKFGMSIRSLANFYRWTIESILSRCITVWYGKCSAQDRKNLLKVVCTAQTITEANLPSMDSIYVAHCRIKAANIIKEPSHP
eukprot:g41494.t1